MELEMLISDFLIDELVDLNPDDQVLVRDWSEEYMPPKDLEFEDLLIQPK